MLFSFVILHSLISNLCFPLTDTSSSEMSSEVDYALQESRKHKKTHLSEQAGILTVCDNNYKYTLNGTDVVFFES